MPAAQPNAHDRILQTAHDLFYRDGIRATGIDKIIKEAGVTKVTFYRHFPAKDALVRAFLNYRHERWIGWFRASLAHEITLRHSFAAALCATLDEWFRSEAFRGCAFINTAVELADALPESLALAQSHKQEMTRILAEYLPKDETGLRLAAIIAMGIDGAIVKAQRDARPDEAIKILNDYLKLLPA
ncbi:TetR/AcrR family transcriptional regulator [Enterobacteriaceae bacterium H20N1]|uniref:TetR/AcrR family transcriptional regulator n=1 Tax=Dryocola boscaweniae TaxID=2925397 RepID=A0A9X2W638_9ENTR|nr:TetR/AcrR family transcriptional regulator [Dryocola boscaweniae]MCT4701281.1 TetR/AcrR family transcriptional regulator [Dryocola boscaweniae]MCT4716032.1 TetR/AcrR family transcriptional regulator [Dryocola boscaweniae]MCT4718483.1 TetR/AcrR family transcriptional regulator [Dryocola boscaweniae]